MMNNKSKVEELGSGEAWLKLLPCWSVDERASLKKKRYIFHSPRRGGGLLRLSRAFSATVTGRFGIGTVRMGAEGRW
jgi:hypothetical protein